MKIHYSSRLFLYLPFLVLLALAFASVLRWRQLAGDLEERLLASNRGREIAPGVTLHFGSEAIGGVPFNLDAVLGDVTLTVNATHGPLVWHTEQFAMHELTYGRAQQVFEAAGKQTLTWIDRVGSQHRFEFVPGSLRASAISVNGSLVRFDLDLEGIGAHVLSGAGAQLHLRRSVSAIDFAISAESLHLSPALQIGFGPDIADLSLSGRFVPVSAFLPLFAGDDEWRHAAESWRHSGGSLFVNHLSFAAGKFALLGSGTFSLDVAHRPQGLLALDVVQPQVLPEVEAFGFARALRQLSNENLTKANVRLLAKLDAGAANLSPVGAAQSPVSAGSLDPLY